MHILLLGLYIPTSAMFPRIFPLTFLFSGLNEPFV